jgi:hypothetical protein
VLEGVSLPRPLPLRSTHHSLRSLVLLMHHSETTQRLVGYLLDMSLCFIVCLLTRRLLYSDQSLALRLEQSSMLSPLLALNHNTGIDSAAILASRFIPRRLFSVTMLRLYALWKATQIVFKRSFATLIFIRCGSAKRSKLEGSLLSGNPLLRCLPTASLSYFLDRNTRTSYASLA